MTTNMIFAWVCVLFVLTLFGIYALFFCTGGSSMVSVIGGIILAVMTLGMFAIGYMSGITTAVSQMTYVDDGKPDQVILKFMGWEKHIMIKHEVDK